MPNARASTDEETAPLLDENRRDDSFFSALLHPARPLTNLEKILAGGAVLLLLLTSTFVGLFAGAESALKKRPGGETVTVTTTAHATATTTVGSTPTGKPSANVCLTSDCVILSSTILQALNTSVDPCENFYEFAVGGWKATHSIPDDKPLIGTFSEVDDRNKKLLIEIIAAIPDKLNSSPGAHEENLDKLKTTYNSCMDIEKLNEIGVEPLIKLTDQIIELFGPFDLVPAPNSELADQRVDWRGLWHDYPRLPDYLIESAMRKDALDKSKSSAGRKVDRNSVQPQDIEESKTTVEKERRDKITQTLAWLDSRGASAFVNFEIEGDAGGDDPQMQSLYLYQAVGGLPTKEYYEEKPILDLYHSVVKGILIDIASHSHRSVKRGLTEDLIEDLALQGEGWPWPWPGKGDDPDGDDKTPGRGGSHKTDEPLDERMETLAGKIVVFERELMRAGADPEFLANPKYAYNPYPTQKVGKALPFLDIPQYLAAFGVRNFPENITVTHPPYLNSVTHLVDATPDYVLSGYFTLRLAMAHGSALGYDTGVWQQLRRLKETLSGLKPGTKEVRQDVCLRWVDEIVGYIAGAEFVDKAFGQDARQDAENIINSIIKTFHDRIPNVAWMDKESAEAAQLKANSIRPRIGYATTPNVVDPQSVANWYRAVDVTSGDFFGTVLSSTLAEENRVWQTLGKRRDNGTWEMTPQTVNAYYNPPDSEITFPAGILQPPFYSKSFPTHLNYGAFGAVAAHELGHAFDNTGAQYDERGRLRDWWTNTTVEAFEERAQCLAKQYSKYYILDPNGKKVYVNGNLTNGENIGDAGLSQAYNAWKTSLSSSSTPKTELRLPGLDFTDEQLFFMAFARVWADLIRPASAVSRVRSDPHSPNIWRAMGTLRNSAEFHKAFGCKVGSGMNPPKEEQCQLWA